LLGALRSWMSKHGSPARKQYEKSKRRRMRESIATLKDKPCADCGGRFHPWVMEFDHRPEHDKKRNVTKMVSGGSWAALAREIAKCDLVCANCHRMRTLKRSIECGAPTMHTLGICPCAAA
jgi:hypothetical protein